MEPHLASETRSSFSIYFSYIYTHTHKLFENAKFANGCMHDQGHWKTQGQCFLASR